jgi:hypothetical protein
MKIKSITLWLILTVALPVLGAGAQDNIPIQTARDIEQGFLNRGHVSAGIGDRIKGAIEYTRHCMVGALAGIGLGLVVTNRVSNSSHCEMAPIIGAGAVAGGLGGAWWCWYGNDEYSKQDYSLALIRASNRIVNNNSDIVRLNNDIGEQRQRAVSAEGQVVTLQQTNAAFTSNLHELREGTSHGLLFHACGMHDRLKAEAIDRSIQLDANLSSYNRVSVEERLKEITDRQPILFALIRDLKQSNTQIDVAGTGLRSLFPAQTPT